MVFCETKHLSNFYYGAKIMIIFLYGQDTYRMREKLNEVVESYKKIHKSGLNLRYFDCSEKTAEDTFNNLKDEIRQASMFEEKKLAVVINPFLDSEFKEKFLKERKDLLKSEDIILLYEEGKIAKNDSLFKFFIKDTKSQEFQILSGQKLKNWVRRRFERYETKIESDALEMLIEHVGSDLWRMNNEIKKLVSYKNNTTVKKEDIKLLTRSKIETDIFKTIDAISQKNKKQALNLLHKHLEKGDSPLYLLSMINFQFRNLLIVKDFVEKYRPYSVILKKSGLHPFVVKKSYSLSQEFSIRELKKIYRRIFQVDLDIKTGRIESKMALDLLIAEI